MIIGAVKGLLKLSIRDEKRDDRRDVSGSGTVPLDRNPQMYNRIFESASMHDLLSLDVSEHISQTVIRNLPDNLLSLRSDGITPRMVLALLKEMPSPRHLPKLAHPPDLRIAFLDSASYRAECARAGEKVPSARRVQRCLEEGYAALEKRGEGWSEAIRAQIRINERGEICPSRQRPVLMTGPPSPTTTCSNTSSHPLPPAA